MFAPQQNSYKPQFRLSACLGDKKLAQLHKSPFHQAGVTRCIHLGDYAESLNNSFFFADCGGNVRQWNFNPTEKSFTSIKLFQAHKDWVNDLDVLAPASEQQLLITGSSDSTVKLWDNNQQCIKTLFHHTDYVSTIAANPQANLIASAGLDTNVVIYDAQTSQKLFHCSSLSYSFYSSAWSPNSAHPTLIAGDSQGSLHLFDPKMTSNQPVLSVELHQDNIRSILVGQDGNQLTTSSSDGTCILWDLRQRKPIQSLDIYSTFKNQIQWNKRKPFDSSMWFCRRHPEMLSQSKSCCDISKVLIGARDGTIFSLNWKNQNSQLILPYDLISKRFLSDTPNASMYNQFDNKDHYMVDFCITKDLIVSSTCSVAPPINENAYNDQYLDKQCTIYSAPDFSRLKQLQNDDIVSAESKNVAEPSQSTSNNLETSELSNSTILKIIFSIPIVPIFKKCRLLNDQAHLLVQDTNGKISLWNILKSTQSRVFPSTESYDKLLSKFRSINNIPKWCTVSVKSGKIWVTLEPETCFNSIILSNSPPICTPTKPAAAHQTPFDTTQLSSVSSNTQIETVNIGARFLKALFCHWDLLNIPQGTTSGTSPGASPGTSPGASPGASPRKLNSTSTAFKLDDSVRVALTCAESGASLWEYSLPQLRILPPNYLPNWVSHFLRNGVLYSADASKFSFFLGPDKMSPTQKYSILDGFGRAHYDPIAPNDKEILGASAWLVDQWIPHQRKQFTAARYLLISNIMQFVLKSLSLPIPVDENGAKIPLDNFMSLRCRGKVVHSSTPLFNCQDTFWKRGDRPVELLYYFDAKYRNQLVSSMKSTNGAATFDPEFEKAKQNASEMEAAKSAAIEASQESLGQSGDTNTVENGEKLTNSSTTE